MKILTKTFVMRGVSLRLFALLCGVTGIVWVEGWKSRQINTRFLIELPRQPTLPVGGGNHAEGDSNSCLIEGNHDGIELLNASLKGVGFRNARFAGAHITSSDLDKADLRNADFSRAIVYFSSFAESNLAGSDLSKAKFHGSDFTGANLANTKLFRTYLIHSDFNGADLSNADLTEANLGDARLENSIGLTYKQLKKAVINQFTTLPPHLAPKQLDLYRKSRETSRGLKRRLSGADYDAWKHPFFELN